MDYLVIFLNYDGKELYKVMVPAGGTAVYAGDTPQKPNEEFVGWSKPLNNVNDNMFVTAVFEKPRTGVLKVAGISFEEAGKDIRVIDDVIISNEDLQKNKDVEVER